MHHTKHGDALSKQRNGNGGATRTSQELRGAVMRIDQPAASRVTLQDGRRFLADERHGQQPPQRVTEEDLYLRVDRCFLPRAARPLGSKELASNHITGLQHGRKAAMEQRGNVHAPEMPGWEPTHKHGPPCPAADRATNMTFQLLTTVNRNHDLARWLLSRVQFAPRGGEPCSFISRSWCMRSASRIPTPYSPRSCWSSSAGRRAN